MPFSSLENKVLYSILFLKESIFNFTTRFWLCMFFVRDMFLGLDKLSAKVIKCVLGYSRLQKGY